MVTETVSNCQGDINSFSWICICSIFYLMTYLYCAVTVSLNTFYIHIRILDTRVDNKMEIRYPRSSHWHHIWSSSVGASSVGLAAKILWNNLKIYPHLTGDSTVHSGGAAAHWAAHRIAARRSRCPQDSSHHEIVLLTWICSVPLLSKTSSIFER